MSVDAGAEDAVARVLELTGGGADVVFEVLGSERTFTQALAMVRDGGRLVAVGIAPAGVTAPVEITRLVRRSIHVIGSYGARVRADMPTILELVESGAISPAASSDAPVRARRRGGGLRGARPAGNRRPGDRRDAG